MQATNERIKATEVRLDIHDERLKAHDEILNALNQEAKVKQAYSSSFMGKVKMTWQDS